MLEGSWRSRNQPNVFQDRDFEFSGKLYVIFCPLRDCHKKTSLTFVVLIANYSRIWDDKKVGKKTGVQEFTRDSPIERSPLSIPENGKMI